MFRMSSENALVETPLSKIFKKSSTKKAIVSKATDQMAYLLMTVLFLWLKIKLKYRFGLD